VPWFDRVSPVTFETECEGSRHTLTWRAGQLHLDQHPEPDAERALVALGGRIPRCVEILDLWDAAVADGGFLEEWAPHHNADHRRRWWLRTALERLRGEGVQDFLFDLPRDRAMVMAEASIALPHELLDRAAGAVVAAADRDSWEVEPSLVTHVAEAVRLRLRRSFVTSLDGTMGMARSAALVPFRCKVGLRVRPGVEGRLAGRGSQVVATVQPSWLSRVWARGVAVHDGRLTLDALEVAGIVTLRQVDWRPASGPNAGGGDGEMLEPVLVDVVLHPGE
jgi:hypothetical protein